MDFQLAVFDLDGVIVDTAKYHYLAWHRLGRELGFEFTEDDNERLKGVSRMRSLEILLEIGNVKKSPAEKEDLAARKNSWYVDFVLQMDSSEILPGVQSFLAELKAAEIKIALGSASKNARTILDRIKLEHYFDAVIDGNVIAKAKPDPEVFLLAASSLQIDPRQAVVFEDAQAGIAAGLKAGMFTVGIGDPAVLSSAHLVLPGFSSLSLGQFRRLKRDRENQSS